MAKQGLWNRISSAFERSDIGGSSYADEDTVEVRPTATRYTVLRDAIEHRISSFLRHDLVSHLEIGFNEIFVLHYIEITADGQGEEVLAQFLHEFSPKARVEWVKKLLGTAAGRHVSVTQFLALDREFSTAALAETDPFEEQLNQGAHPLYRVVLHGRWETAPEPLREETQPQDEAADEIALRAQPQPAPLAPPPLTRAPGPRVYLAIHDAKALDGATPGGARSIELDRFPAVLGSSAHADIEVSGYYVSARHCTLHCEGGILWLADHSTNGTWVDGERMNRGKRAQLANGALLSFGCDSGPTTRGGYDRFPKLRLQLAREPVDGVTQFTPVAPSLATPVAPSLAPAPAKLAAPVPLAVLVIDDATGNAQRDLIKLPYGIGRGSAQDYVVPEANQGVSREHLVIESIDASGAQIRNCAVHRNGTFAGGQPLPERFVWRFGEQLLLGEKWSDAPPVRIALQRCERAP